MRPYRVPKDMRIQPSEINRAFCDLDRVPTVNADPSDILFRAAALKYGPDHARACLDTFAKQYLSGFRIGWQGRGCYTPGTVGRDLEETGVHDGCKAALALCKDGWTKK
jgi:hypothetical protein